MILKRSLMTRATIQRGKGCNMKVKFTKASKKDSALVTVSLKELDDVVSILDCTGRDGNPSELEKASEFVLAVDGVRTVFTVNRSNKTATTKAFPRTLKMPSVGKPIYAEVSNVGVLI